MIVLTTHHGDTELRGTGKTGGYDFKWSIEVLLRKGRKGKQEMRQKEQVEK